MTCKHCGASIYENDIKCPYCDCYIDRAPQPQVPPMQQNRPLFQGEDKPVTALMVVSFLIPILGIILGIVLMANGQQKSGRTYLILGAAAIGVSILFTTLLPLLFSFGMFFNMK